MQRSSEFLQVDSDHRACLTCRTGEGYRAVYLMAYYGVMAIMFSKVSNTLTNMTVMA